MGLRLFSRCAGLVVLIAGVSAQAGGCTAAPTAPSSPGLAVNSTWRLDPRAMLPIASQRWRKAGITRYDLTVSIGCFCFHLPREFTFQVRDGVSVAPGLDPVARESLSDYESVEAMFGLLEASVARGAHHFDVEFDAVLGFPRRGVIDHQQFRADDNFSFIVELRPVP